MGKSKPSIAEQFVVLYDLRERVREGIATPDRRWLEAVARVRAKYPEGVFPAGSKSWDAQAGTFARGICDQIVALATEE